MRLFRDFRVWIGFGVTGLCLWLAVRNVDLGGVVEALELADWRLIVFVAVPSNLLAIFIRAHRWRYLTDPIHRYDLSSLFRATGIGMMANNILPLRMGEFIRAWALSKESGGQVTRLFGTVVFERILDMGFFLLLIMGVLAFHDFGGDGRISPNHIAEVAVVALLGVVLLRLRPDLVLAIFQFCCRPLPAKLREKLEFFMKELIEGLVSVRGARAWTWIGFDSFLIWCVACTIPFVLGIASVGIEFDFWRLILAAFATQVAVGLFIAAPSAPGFFGPYHLACQFALVSFGVTPEKGLAAGVVIHLSFWLPVTIMGFGQFLSFHQGMSLGEAAAVARSGKGQAQ